MHARRVRTCRHFELTATRFATLRPATPAARTLTGEAESPRQLLACNFNRWFAVQIHFQQRALLRVLG